MIAGRDAGMRRRNVRRFAATFPVLADALQDSGVRRLLLAARLVRFEPGMPLVHRGQQTDELFLILEGTVRTTNGADPDTELWTAGAGGVIGMAEFVDPGVAALMTTATTRCSALVLRHDQLLALGAAEPHVAQVLLDHVAAELMRARNRLKTLFSTLRMENLA